MALERHPGAPRAAGDDQAPATVVLVRHGETEWNRQGRIQGSTDIPMNDSGRHQARRAAARLAGRAPWAAVLTSPLSRATETASILAGRLGTRDPLVEAAFAERRHGALEGLTAPERRRLESSALHIDGLEPRSAVVARVAPALRRLGSQYPGGAVVAVTHGGVIQSLLLHLLELPSLPSGSVGNGSVHELLVSDRGIRLVRTDAVDVEEPTAIA